MQILRYIRLLAEFVYLALILDGFSRKVVGWKLDRTLASRLATDALEHLRSNIEEFIERYYNQKHLHFALGYRSPEEFEQRATSSNAETTLASTVRFFQKPSEDSSTALIGKGLKRRPFPMPHPCWRINEMSLREIKCL